MSTLSHSQPATSEIDHSIAAGPPDNSGELSDVAVIIPALNESESLPLVLADLPPVGDVIVVDNGSTDATADVAARCGATVVFESSRGYGAACLRGLAVLRDRPVRPRIVVFLDGDYSDHPDLLPVLVEPIRSGQAEFVLGSRLTGDCEPGAMPPQSRYGNRLACCLMRMLFASRYTDLGPFRAIDYQALSRLEMLDRNFGWTVEMQIKATQAGLRTLEIPVPYRRRVGTSKISGTVSGTIQAGWKILYLIARYGFLQRQPPGSVRTVSHSSVAETQR